MFVFQKKGLVNNISAHVMLFICKLLLKRVLSLHILPQVFSQLLNNITFRFVSLPYFSATQVKNGILFSVPLIFSGMFVFYIYSHTQFESIILGFCSVENRTVVLFCRLSTFKKYKDTLYSWVIYSLERKILHLRCSLFFFSDEESP